MELSLSLGLVAMSLAPIALMMSSGTGAARTSLDEVAATGWLTDLVEQIEAASPRALPETVELSSADGWLADGASLPGGIVLHLPQLPRGLVATLAIDTPAPGLRRVRATARRGTLDVRIETLVEAM